MVSIAQWIHRQTLVFSRFSRRYRVPLTPEVAARLARRFALKELRAIAEGRGPHGRPRLDPPVNTRAVSSARFDVRPAHSPDRATRPWRARRLVRPGHPVVRFAALHPTTPRRRRSP